MSFSVFLGGTCNGSDWRDRLVPLLSDNIVSFNPVVENWTHECQEAEIKARKDSNYCLYVISPKMTGIYSIAEVVDDSNKCPTKTMLCVLESDDGFTFTKHQLASLSSLQLMVSKNGANVFPTLGSVARYLNGL